MVWSGLKTNAEEMKTSLVSVFPKKEKKWTRPDLGTLTIDAQGGVPMDEGMAEDRSPSVSEDYVIHIKKLNRTGMDRMGLRSEAMSWARRNRDVGESEMSC